MTDAEKLRKAAELLNEADALIQSGLQDSDDAFLVLESVHNTLADLVDELEEAASELDTALIEEIRAHALSKLTATEREILGV